MTRTLLLAAAYVAACVVVGAAVFGSVAIAVGLLLAFIGVPPQDAEVAAVLAGLVAAGTVLVGGWLSKGGGS
jgi:ABC-type transport system involved in multi-copper enzyme maturation permease subunit